MISACRLGYLAFLIVSVGFFGLGLISKFRTIGQAKTAIAMALDPPILFFADTPPGRDLSVTFTLTNRSRQPIEVVGATRFCTPLACFDVLESLPLEIPVNGTREIRVNVKTRAPGLVENGVVLFTSCPGSPEVLLQIKGTVINDKGGEAEK